MTGVKLNPISPDSVTKLDHSRALQSHLSHRNHYGAVYWLDKFLIKGQKYTELDVYHPEKRSRAEENNASLKLEDLEGMLSSIAGRTTTEQDTP